MRKLTVIESENLPDLENNVHDVEDKEEQDIEQEELNWVQLLTSRRYKEARELLVEEIKVTSEIKLLVFLKCESALILSYYDFNQAVYEFKTLIDEHASHSIVYSSFSNIYSRTRQYEEAISVIDEGIKQFEDSEKYNLILTKAELLETSHRLDESKDIAKEVAEKSISDNQKSQAYLQIGQIQEKQNTRNEARNSYLKAYSANPNNRDNVFNISEYFREINDYRTELVFRKRLVNINSNNSIELGYLGNCYVALGLFSLAMESYKKALSVNELDTSWVVSNIGNIFNNVGLYSTAVEILNEALEKGQKNEYAYNRLSQALENHQSEQSREREIIDSVSVEPKDLDAASNSLRIPNLAEEIK